MLRLDRRDLKPYYRNNRAKMCLGIWRYCFRFSLIIMRRKNFLSFASWDRGESMIETALILPMLLLLAFNAINFGYFFFAAVNLAAAPRTGVEYSIVGFATPSQLQLPDAGPATTPLTVSFLTYEDMRGVLPSSANARVQVCTAKLGLNGSGSTQKANCAQYGSGTETYTPASDPEAPFFVLNRVDVVYQINPLIPAFQLPTPGGPISLSLLPSLRIHRSVSMRVMD